MSRLLRSPEALQHKNPHSFHTPAVLFLSLSLFHLSCGHPPFLPPPNSHLKPGSQALPQTRQSPPALFSSDLTHSVAPHPTGGCLHTDGPGLTFSYTSAPCLLSAQHPDSVVLGVSISESTPDSVPALLTAGHLLIPAGQLTSPPPPPALLPAVPGSNSYTHSYTHTQGHTSTQIQTDRHTNTQR